MGHAHGNQPLALLFIQYIVALAQQQQTIGRVHIGGQRLANLDDLVQFLRVSCLSICRATLWVEYLLSIINVKA